MKYKVKFRDRSYSVVADNRMEAMRKVRKFADATTLTTKSQFESLAYKVDSKFPFMRGSTLYYFGNGKAEVHFFMWKSKLEKSGYVDVKGNFDINWCRNYMEKVLSFIKSQASNSFDVDMKILNRLDAYMIVKFDVEEIGNEKLLG